jgi:hypothetical protein
MARVQQKSTRQNHRLSRSSGIPCAMVLTLIRDLPGDRLSCPRLRQCACAPCADLSTGRPGPHDFTSVMRRSSARASASCDTPRPPHPRLTCRDDRAQPPLNEAGWRDIITISEKWKVTYFCPKDWTRHPNQSERAFDDLVCAKAAGLEDQMRIGGRGLSMSAQVRGQMSAGNARRSAIGQETT